MRFVYLKCRPTIRFPFVAWLIMLFQGKNPFNPESTSHRALGYRIGNDWYVIDSTAKHGVQDTLLVNFLDGYSIKESIHFENELPEDEFLEWKSGILGLKYDKLQIVGLMLKLLGFVTFNSVGSNYRKLICTEVFLYFAERFYGIPVGDPDNWDLNLTDTLAREIADDTYFLSRSL